MNKVVRKIELYITVELYIISFVTFGSKVYIPLIYEKLPAAKVRLFCDPAEDPIRESNPTSVTPKTASVRWRAQKPAQPAG